MNDFKLKNKPMRCKYGRVSCKRIEWGYIISFYFGFGEVIHYRITNIDAKEYVIRFIRKEFDFTDEMVEEFKRRFFS